MSGALLPDHPHLLAEELRAYPTLSALRTSPRGAVLLERAEALLDTLREHCAPEPPAPLAGRGLRVVHWNIEHGNRYEAVERGLAEHAELRAADLVLLNEVDLGMARSGNRDVAFELARRLGMNAAWGAMFLELGVGRHEDPGFAAGAANRESLFGLALLSRFPLGRARALPLPSPMDLHFERERMLGRHVALIVEVLHPAGAVVAVATHLDVQRRPRHRTDQMRAILEALAAESRPVVFAGDFNTSTFRRGSVGDALEGLAALALMPGPALRGRLLRPDRPARKPREPLFAELSRAGFEWENLNDFEPSLRLRFERLGEVEALPPRLRRATLRALAPVQARAQLRLDWICARGFAAGKGRTVAGLDVGPGQASDHAPLVAELELPASPAGSR